MTTIWAPPADYLGDHAPGTEAWAAARRGGLGGSEIAPVLGISPFESRFSLWHRHKGLVGGIEESPEMEWGKRLEDAVAAKFADEHPEYDVRPGGAWRNRDRPWQIGHPDRLLVPRDPDQPVEVLEVKTAVLDIGWGEPGGDDIPVYYRTQAFHYLDTLGLSRARIAVLIGGFDYREYVIDLDDAEQASIRAQCEEFLADVAADRRPDIDAHTETYQVIRELHPDIHPETVDLDEQVAAGYLAANAAFKTAQDHKRLCTALVADAMGSAQRARHGEQVIATRISKQGGTPYVHAKPRKDHAA